MTKKIKTTILAFLVFTTMFAFGIDALAVSRDTANEEINVVVGNPQEAYNRDANNFSGEIPQGAWPPEKTNVEEARAAAYAKLENAPKTYVSPRANWLYIPYDTYKIYQQETKTWCGPAVLQSVIKVLSGSYITQTSIYNAVKYTDDTVRLDDMTAYVNTRQNVNEYVFFFASETSQADMKDFLYTGIVDYGAPSMIGLTFKEGGPWKFTTNGHFVSVYGAKADQSAFMLGDPYVVKYCGASDPYYEVQASTLYTAFSKNDLGISY